MPRAPMARRIRVIKGVIRTACWPLIVVMEEREPARSISASVTAAVRQTGLHQLRQRRGIHSLRVMGGRRDQNADPIYIKLGIPSRTAT